uniref:Uncharacterized protein n=1 Tax=Glossina pallidipes TaxID=7398 RepID=A0A1A9ZND0_GLOPL
MNDVCKRQNQWGVQVGRYRFSIIISVFVGLSYLLQFLRATVYDERVQKLVLSFNAFTLKFYNNCDKPLQRSLEIKLILRMPARIVVGFPIKLHRYEVYVFLFLNVHLHYCKLYTFWDMKELRLCSMSNNHGLAGYCKTSSMGDFIHLSQAQTIDSLDVNRITTFVVSDILIRCSRHFPKMYCNVM